MGMLFAGLVCAGGVCCASLAAHQSALLTIVFSVSYWFENFLLL